MGILNVTPDSFSDGGDFFNIEDAIKRAKEMEEEGADVIDIGGESTGINTTGVNIDEEINRVIPILKEIRKFSKIPISIDTYKSELAEKALQEGANIINDVTGLRADSKLAKVVAKHNAKLIIMYAKDETARTKLHKQEYDDMIQTIKDFLEKQIHLAKEAGIKKENIIIDPGFGHFISAIPKYSYEIIARLKELEEMSYPILIGISRKSFLGGQIESRDERGLPLSAIAYLNGASIIRTHNVKGTKEFFEKFNS